MFTNAGLKETMQKKETDWVKDGVKVITLGAQNCGHALNPVSAPYVS